MNSTTSSSSDSRFLIRLESVRGLAAICVAMVHCFVIFPYAGEDYPLQSAAQTIVHIIFQGTSALIVFFVISGYVLALSLDRSETTLRNIFIFYMRRAFRIFPAHCVWIFIALAMLGLFYTPGDIPGADSWFNNMNSEELNIVVIFFNLLLVITSIIPGEWTLTLELIVYIIYPFMYLINRRGGKFSNITLLIFLLATSLFLGQIRLFHYLVAFYFGLAAPEIYKSLFDRISDKAARRLLWTSIALLLLFPILRGNFKFATLIVQVVAGGYLIFACIYLQQDNRFFRLLDWPPVARMGQISYSFYVSHFLINYWTAYFLFGVFGHEAANEYRFFFMMLVAAISIPIAYRCSTISYAKIEAPMMKYSSNLSKKWRKANPVAELA